MGRLEGKTKRELTNNDIHQDTKSTLQVVGLLITQEIADDEDGKDEDNNVEGFESEVHALVQAPAYEDDQRRVEECGLDGSSEDVSKGKVHLIIPCFVYGSQVFRRFLHQRYQDETHEEIGNVVFFHDEFYLLNYNERKQPSLVSTWRS